MNTLVLSFLRLGDFFQHVYLLRELARAPERKITIFGFTELKPAIPLFPEFSFELISRNEILQELTQREHPWYRAGWVLEQKIRKVQETNWRLIANLSHTLFSARLMDCLQAEEKWGVQFENGKSAGWNPWMVEMNNNWVSNQKPDFTYVELLARAMGLQLPLPEKATTEGQEIWVQPLTSDEKKNWALGNWQAVVQELAQTYAVRVIGAPNEVRALTPWFPQAEAMSFAQIRNQKGNCRLLVSGDTSVIHFAALEKIPTVGVYLGSANPLKTPPRQLNAKIVVGAVACWPCPHRSLCPQATHKCGEAVSTKDVLKAIEQQIATVGGSTNQLGGSNGEGRRRASLEHAQEA